MNTIKLSDILQLSVQERIQLAEDIWDSIASAPESLSLTEEQKKELDRRLLLLEKNPGQTIPWEKVKEKLRSLP